LERPSIIILTRKRRGIHWLTGSDSIKDAGLVMAIYGSMMIMPDVVIERYDGYSIKKYREMLKALR
jgi:hypothetical protein